MTTPMKALVTWVLLGACAGAGAADRAGSFTSPPASVSVLVDAVADPQMRDDVGVAPIRLVFVGDVMLGRSVAPVVAGDPSSVFERLRPAIVSADLAFANLESPLTTRSHLSGEFALEADPGSAFLLAGAGFDVLNIANNHATDAGPATVLDTLDALSVAGLTGVGGGASTADAAAPAIVDVHGVRVGVIAFDLAGGTAATGSTPGISTWDASSAEPAIRELRRSVDVVVVSLHGGVEYLPRPDPVLARIAGLAADWGADVVWGHGAHVPYPVEPRRGVGGDAVVAAGLGNALFDQRLPGTQSGAALEVLVDRDGVVAMRTGRVAIEAGRSAFEGWDPPDGDAVSLDGDWWTPVRPVTASESRSATSRRYLPDGYVEVARAQGDVTGNGAIDTVVSYRRPIRDEPIHALFDAVQWADPAGRSAHLAVYNATGRMRWGSAVLFQPIGSIAVCDGALALGFTALDDPATVAGGAWIWDGFGFRTAPVLPGSAVVGCTDIDHDGRSEPMLIARPTRPND